MDIRVLLGPHFFVRLTSAFSIMLMHRSLVIVALLLHGCDSGALLHCLVKIMLCNHSMISGAMECIANTINPKHPRNIQLYVLNSTEALQGSHQERTRFLYAFKHGPDINTVFLSKLFSVQNSDLSVFSLAVLPHQLRKGMEVMKIDMVFARKLCWEKLLAVNVGVKLYLGIRFKGGFDMRSVWDLVNKRGCGKIDGQKVPLTDNNIYGILNIEGIVSEITLVGLHFKEVVSFLCPFQLNKPKKGLQGRKKLYNDGGDAGNREDHISELILALT
ncbi:hypothetical protein NE237_003214 [Protea cynaroides]|uniref:Uncharacterized protein n=1 Tax=Protea cynaroides TaxID=273540 RepID=A0A9Q0KGN5_9MAGN|nr:hypothetical protein NE237_003214 [Protea cynaroides]